MLKCITAELQINIFAPPTEQENEVKQRPLERLNLSLLYPSSEGNPV